MKYKLKIWLEDEGVGEWRDLYFDVNHITAFFIPNDKDDKTGKAINIYFNGDVFTIKQEKHILDYLLKEFVNVAIENK